MTSSLDVDFPTGVCLSKIDDNDFRNANQVVVKNVGNMPIAKGDFRSLPSSVQKFIVEKALLMRPCGIYICDGSVKEADELTKTLVESGILKRLKKRENCYLCRTDPRDVARVESKTWIVTADEYETVTRTKSGVKPIMGNWMSQEQLPKELDDRFPGCMVGRMMYVIPFSMGPIGGPFSKIGVELTDSSYVVLNMRIMTRVSPSVWDALGNGSFVRCIHSVGLPCPIERNLINKWPCKPDKVMIVHRPVQREVWSFGSGYGGNSLLAKKCFALRIASCMGRDEGWLAEHMLIISVTNPEGKERFIVAAFPSACGKTNMAMLRPTLPGWSVKCIGDDIAWLRFRSDGRLVAINPENGFFGVCPGTNNKTNPVAMECVQKNTIFTNVAETADGDVFWEGLEKEIEDTNVQMTNWRGEAWKIGLPGKAAHANSRFTTPARQCPTIHPLWESPDGVPIDAIIFGGRHPEGVPLVCETFSWAHGVFTGATLKSEATAAAEHKGKQIMHDPMGMRPFMGYNFGVYLRHWLNMDKQPNKVPKIFRVNWFRLDKDKKFLWPGFGENIRVLDWIFRRLDNEEIAVESPIGLVPKPGSINLEGLGEINLEELFSLPKEYWKEDTSEVRHFLESQVWLDLPLPIRQEMEAQEKRVSAM